jgi:hypothetical protein
MSARQINNNKDRMMKAYWKGVVLALCFCLAIAPCQGKTKNIPYRVANGYFVRNDVKKVPTAKITSSQQFFSYFGCAPVMGKDGEPTRIDFQKEYVLAVCKPETWYSTELTPVSLRREKKNVIVFTYRVTKGEKQTYSINPCLMIIVSRQAKGKVVFRER